jgi:hypothetical protein
LAAQRKNCKSGLWIVWTNGARPVRMTSDRAGDRSPQISPNNEIN